MTWLILTLASAVVLGCYDFLKKLALKDNAVLPTIFVGICAGSLVWLPLVIWSACSPETLPSSKLHVTGISWLNHGQLFFKSVLVVASWIFGYLGLKKLPLSIATPIRATSPLWTITFALLLFHESPSFRQWLGVGTILFSFYLFSLAGKKEGITFHRSSAVLLIICATVLGSCSALLDKYLLQTVGLSPTEVQAWFSIYSAPAMFPAFVWWCYRKDRNRFHWRWSIPAIGLSLLVADWFYFTAVAEPDAFISLISPVRRSAVIISFFLGIFVLKEQFRWSKILAILGILGGLFLLS